MKRIALIPGDGIGPEVTAEVLRVLAACSEMGLPLEVAVFGCGADRYLSTGRILDPGEFEAIAAHDAIFVGALGDPRIPDMVHARDILLGIRRRLDLFVNERPLRLLHESLSPLSRGRVPAQDLTVFRENTEGEYAGIGGALRQGGADEVAVESAVSTRRGVERLVRHAFREAVVRGVTRVTLCDKHNAQRFGGDLWHRTFLSVAEEFPSVSAGHQFVDALCMNLVLDPGRFGFIVASNLFGDIVSDLGAALIGGPGMAPSANYNPSTGQAMFEPVHGSAPSLAGQGRANPFAALLSGAMMLEHLGFREVGEALWRAVAACVEKGETTGDLGGTLSTSEVGEAATRRMLGVLARSR